MEKLKYQLVSADAGIKYKGLALEAEYYWRWLSDFVGPNTGGLADIDDHGFQVQSSAMAVPKRIQVYLGGSAIRGRYGNGIGSARRRQLVHRQGTRAASQSRSGST